jgi:hypothetical protein
VKKWGEVFLGEALTERRWRAELCHAFCGISPKTVTLDSTAPTHAYYKTPRQTNFPAKISLLSPRSTETHRRERFFSGFFRKGPFPSCILFAVC